MLAQMSKPANMGCSVSARALGHRPLFSEEWNQDNSLLRLKVIESEKSELHSRQMEANIFHSLLPTPFPLGVLILGK